MPVNIQFFRVILTIYYINLLCYSLRQFDLRFTLVRHARVLHISLSLTTPSPALILCNTIILLSVRHTSLVHVKPILPAQHCCVDVFYPVFDSSIFVSVESITLRFPLKKGKHKTEWIYLFTDEITLWRVAFFFFFLSPTEINITNIPSRSEWGIWKNTEGKMNLNKIFRGVRIIIFMSVCAAQKNVSMYIKYVWAVPLYVVFKYACECYPLRPAPAWSTILPK